MGACSVPGIRHRRPLPPTLVTAIAIQFATFAANATDEIQVYNASIAPLHTFTLEQHLNYVWNGSQTPEFAGGFASYHSLNGTPEIAYGITPWYEMGWYVPFSIDSNGTFLPAGFKWRHLFVAPNAEKRNIFYGLNIELGYLTPNFAASPFNIEFRPILGMRDSGWEFIINPIIETSFGSTGQSDFAPAARIARVVAEDVMVGVEYYGDFGPVGNFSPASQQSQSLFGVVDFSAFSLDIEFGVGFGLTEASDKIVTKLIVGHTF